MRTLVLGIGNLLLSDEGIGVRAIQTLEAHYQIPPEVELFDGGTSGMELMEAMADRDLLIVVDAVRSNHDAGSVFILEDEQVPALFTEKLSPHQLGLCDVLMALKMTGEYPRKLILIGIEPASLAPGMALTDTAQRSLGVALREVQRLLAEHGIEIQRQDEPCAMN